MKKSSLFAIVSISCIVLAIPITLMALSQQQDLRQRANELTKLFPTKSGTTEVAGYVYNDDNKNGERDLNEKPLKDIMIQITDAQKSDEKAEVKTDSEGYFRYQFERSTASQSFFVKVILPTSYVISTTNPLLFSNIQPGSKELVEFALYSDTSDLSISPTATASAVPDCTKRPACMDATPRCLITEPSNGWCPQVSPTPKAACKVITTYARNDKTKVCRTFKNSCLPDGWTEDRSCSSTQPTPKLSQ